MSTKGAHTRVRTAAIAAFFIYAIVLATATHWPQLDLGPAPEHSDKVLHFAAFAVWTALLLASGLLGPPLARRTLWLALPVALVYAGLDEATQAIPGVNRHASWADAAANAAGVAAVIGLAAIVRSPLRRWIPGQSPLRPMIFGDSD